MRRPVAIAVLSLALLGLTGCKSACRQLSEKLCDCNTNSVERELCVRRAANDEAVIEPTSSDEDKCDELLNANQCTCDNYQTDEGKVACGLAR
ncbi:MAG: hypothetical protein ACJ8AT_28635 [Hyalangium sp.]|uniref:hypothetical protein n=1 Tax=Hyalangium sp. TaxID=2028555 RepID=UPI0038998882